MYKDLDACRDIAARVLADYAIDEGGVSGVAYFLMHAQDDKPWMDEYENMLRDNYEKRSKIIAALEQLIDLYRTYEPHLIAFHPITREPLTQGYILNELEIILDAEYRLHQKPPPKRPRKRPTTAKNMEATEIFRILCRYGISTWDACGLIAEMFVQVGISDAPPDKTRRALYDRLSRVKPKLMRVR